MNPESIAYDKLMTAIRDCNHEGTLRQAHIVYSFVFDRYMNSSGDEKEELRGKLKRLLETIDSRPALIELSEAFDKLMTLLKSGGQTQ